MKRGSTLKTYKYIILTIITSIILLTACQSEKQPSTSESKSPSATMGELSIYNQPSLEKGTYKAQTLEYNLGHKEYVSSSNRTMPYEIRGIIGIPEGDGPFPLILISHGSHSNDNESLRFDTGFDYLVDHLSQQGFITVAMDMSKPYIWKYGDNDDQEKSIPVANDHIEGLLAANAGENNGFTIDLKGKIDVNNIALVGHSRGGETVFEIANDQAERGRGIKAILSLAPTSLFDHKWPDVDVAVLVPEYDGDIISLDGFNTYRSLSAKGGHHYSVTQLLKANHNYFNRNIERNDAGGSLVENATKDQLSREQQEQFLNEFASDFFKASLSEKESAFILPSKSQPNTMYDDYHVTVLYQQANAKNVVDIHSKDSFQAEGAVIQQKIDSWFYKHDEVNIDTVTFGEEEFMKRALLNIRWEQRDTSVRIQPEVTDFSGFEALTINAVIDSSDEINARDKSQQFSVKLTDTSGNTALLSLPEGLNALAYSTGSMGVTSLEDLDIHYWSRITPLAAINLPLHEFKDIDLTHIESVTLVFDKTEQGSIYVDSIWLN